MHEMCRSLKKFWGEPCNASEPIEDQSFESPVTKFDLRLDDGEEPIASGTSQPSIQHGRNLLDAKISNYKREKLQRKLPVDAQFLSCAQEDLQNKQGLVDEMEQMEKHNMSRLSRNMTESVAEGFSIFKSVVGQ